MPMPNETAAAVEKLAAFATASGIDDLPSEVLQRVRLMLVDLLGVTAAGARTGELRALHRSWGAVAGSAPLIGCATTVAIETAAYLNAIAACALELDEGNKHARGHPAVHVVFAALAAVQLSGRAVSGREFLFAVTMGYEVAARFGRALVPHDPWHTHGHWGATGAACAAALIWEADPAQLAAAIDASTGLIHTTPWSTVTDGNFVRNLWAAGANMAGLHAARLSLSGLAANNGNAAASLGGLVGSLNPDEITRGLGSEWLVAQGYSKIHSSCSYTHAAVDIIQRLKEDHPFVPDDVSSVTIRTHSLARRLFAGGAHNRLSAMFSFPFVASAAIFHPRVDPAAMDPQGPDFAAVNAFSHKVHLEAKPDFDLKLPQERWTEVHIELADGSSLVSTQPNPRGDSDFCPLASQEIQDKLHTLIGARNTATITETVEAIPASPDVGATLAPLGTI